MRVEATVHKDTDGLAQVTVVLTDEVETDDEAETFYQKVHDVMIRMRKDKHNDD